MIKRDSLIEDFHSKLMTHFQLNYFIHIIIITGKRKMKIIIMNKKNKIVGVILLADHRN